MAKFISRYANHRIKSPYGTIEFERNKCHVDNAEQVEFLRNHPDFGVFVFEDEEAKQYICPNCGREFKNPQGLASHMKVCTTE